AALLAACWWQWWPPPPGLVESLYVRACYLRLLALTVPVTEKIPFSITEWLLAGLIAGHGARAVFLVVRARQRRIAWRRALAHLAVLALTLGAALYLGFLALWGLCYARAPIDRRLRWPTLQNEADIAALAQRLVTEAAANRTELSEEEVLA